MNRSTVELPLPTGTAEELPEPAGVREVRDLHDLKVNFKLLKSLCAF